MSARESTLASLFADVPAPLYVYYCPTCQVGTGDRSWHPVGQRGLIPQTQDEHDCTRINVSWLIEAAELARELSRYLGDKGEADLRNRVALLDLSLGRIEEMRRTDLAAALTQEKADR